LLLGVTRTTIPAQAKAAIVDVQIIKEWWDIKQFANEIRS
jgi:hypothetical protein